MIRSFFGMSGNHKAIVRILPALVVALAVAVRVGAGNITNGQITAI